MSHLSTGATTEEVRVDALTAATGVAVSDEQTRALSRYCSLLLEWNRTINLTGAASVAELVKEHLPDSFAAAALLGDAPRVLDVGSGGGLPAVATAILCPRSKFTLVEPRSRRVAFLRTVCRELGLDVQVETCRMQDLAPADLSFDAAMSRATFAPEEWLTLGRACVRPGGVILTFCPAGHARRLGPPAAERVVTLAGHDISAHRV